MGNKIAPGFLDRYLARTGFKNQQTDAPKKPDQPDNLWKPVPGNFSAHGAFDWRAQAFSWQFWWDKHRSAGVISALSLIAVAVAAFLFVHTRS